jgi:large conductance mechanosensitive channel
MTKITSRNAIRQDVTGSMLFDFLIVGFAVFLLIRQVNRLKTEEKQSAVTTKDCPACFSAIAIKATRCPHCTSALTPV